MLVGGRADRFGWWTVAHRMIYPLHPPRAAMLAVIADHKEIAQALARAGADLTLRGTGAPGFAGRTVADLAAARGWSDLAIELAAGKERTK